MTKDELFALLSAAYTGAGSTDEGTFAGDILRACADAMAQLWSMEIDGAEGRAFVATAAGDDLTAVCRDRGVERREGENDEALRLRALESLQRQSSSGNADDYATWCGAVEDILRVRVLPLHRGPGTVDIVAAGQDGRAANAGTTAAAQTVVDDHRPIGADARVIAATEKAVNVTAQVRLADGGSVDAVQTAFAAALSAFLREGALRTASVSYARVSRILLDCDGVEDVTAFTLNGGSASVALGETELAVPGAVTVTEVTA